MYKTLKRFVSIKNESNFLSLSAFLFLSTHKAYLCRRLHKNNHWKQFLNAATDLKSLSFS